MLIVCFFIFHLITKYCFGYNSNYTIYENNVVVDNSFSAQLPTKNLVGINKNGQYESYLSLSAKRIVIKKSQTCGDNSFPHGIYINSKTKLPSMYCEPHRCFKPEYIECFKNVAIEECTFDNEWISGFYSQRNKTHQWIEVECCRFKLSNRGKFIKHVNITVAKEYIHDIVVKNGKMDEFEFANNIQKLYLGSDESLFMADIYRMTCPPNEEFDIINRYSNSPGLKEILSGSTIISNDEVAFFEKNANEDDDGSPAVGIANDGSYVNFYYDFIVPKTITYVKQIRTRIMKSCGKDFFPHGFFLGWMYPLLKVYCEPHSCLKSEKVICTKKSPISSCSDKNEWVAGFEIINQTMKVECCHYQDKLVTTFVKRINLIGYSTFQHDILVENQNLIGIGFVNNITRKRDADNGTFFEASYYRLTCPKPVGGGSDKMHGAAANLHSSTNPEIMTLRLFSIPVKDPIND